MPQDDLFSTFSTRPGNLHVLAQRGSFTVTQSSGGGYVLWLNNRVLARGSMQTISANRSLIGFMLSEKIG